MAYLSAKKSLGQNFLTASAHIRAIADAGNVQRGEKVLEVGPGKGALTKELLSRGAHVIAVEKDDRLISVLNEMFAAEAKRGSLAIEHADILTTPLTSLGLKTGKFKAVANIPYYITGAFMRQLLSGSTQPSHAVLLVQKEVAERIARSKKESLLSLSVKAFGTPRYVRTVPRGAFVPVPNVDSAVLSIENISRKHFSNERQEERFFELLHAGFAQKRKYLARNLESVASAKDIAAAFQKLGIDLKTRAEDLPLALWLSLSLAV